MKLKKISLLFFCGACIEFVLGRLTFNGFATPNLMLCLAIIGTFVSEEPEKWIFISGIFAIIKDILLGTYFGLSVGATLAGCVSMLVLKEVINYEHYLSSIVASVLGTFMYLITLWMLAFIVGSNYDILVVLKFFIIQASLHIVISFVIYHFLVRDKLRQKKNNRYRYYR